MKLKTIIKEAVLRIHSIIQLRMIKRGHGNIVFGKIVVGDRKSIKIGSNCRINEGVLLNSRGGLLIGDDVTISSRSQLITQGLDYHAWSKGNRTHSCNGIKIGDHVWIGAGCIILPGVEISGEYVVIGAGSVVTKSITESRCIYAGNPARLIKKIE